MKLTDFLEQLEIEKLDEFRPDPDSHVLMVTGRMAKPGLTRMMLAIDPDDFTYEIRAMDIQVAAWLTVEKIANDIGDLTGVDLVLVPGKTMGDEKDLEKAIGIKVIRGPGCYSELPDFLEEEGFEQEVSDVPRPKLLVFNDYNVAEFLAKTYEVPFITIDSLIKRAQDDGITSDDFSRHNVLAELVRARLLEPDAKRGFVLYNYPRIARDIEWLEDMKVKQDAVVYVGNKDHNDIIDYYKDKTGFLTINDKDEKSRMANALEKVEMLMQQCVVPDSGMAQFKK